MHLCHNPVCSNPAHLDVGTRKQNHATSKAAGRLQRKIPLGDIKTIIMRVANGESKKVIAAEYGCTPQNIAYTVRTHHG